jgi:glycosyltransferase involved in cell wall biosynthesis
LLHVGSNLARKNKIGVLRVFLRLAAAGWPGRVVFCGDTLPSEISAAVESAGLTARVHALPRVSETELEALYSRAHVLLFPSRGEGFGWPIIEAQACDCPVICSDRTSLPEVGGDAALVHALDDEAGMAASVLKLGEPGFRAAVIGRGRENLVRFSKERMVDAYIELYASVLRAASAPP